MINGEAIRWRSGLSDDQIDQLLRQDLQPAMQAVNGERLTLRQQELDALVSLVFNIGVGAFRKSTLLKRMHSGDYVDVPAQMLRWVYAGGQRVQGLINRRRAEADLWLYNCYGGDS